MADAYEYKVVLTYFMFYVALVFILGTMGVASAEAEGYGEITGFQGLKSMFGAPFGDEEGKSISVLYYIFITSPLILFLTMLTINTIARR